MIIDHLEGFKKVQTQYMAKLRHDFEVSGKRKKSMN